MTHKENCPISIAQGGSWYSTAKPMCNCFQFTDTSGYNGMMTGALTPLGEEKLKALEKNEPNTCQHQFVFSHQAQEARGDQVIFQTVIYVICPKCGLVKWQV